jgi:hypothetical protein
VGFTLATALFGNLWAYVNPWTGPYRLVTGLQRAWASKSSNALAAGSPPPSRRRRALKMWGRDRACPGLDPGVGGSPELRRSGFPPPLAPPRVMSCRRRASGTKTCFRHDGEGNALAQVGNRWATTRPPWRRLRPEPAWPRPGRSGSA